MVCFQFEQNFQHKNIVAVEPPPYETLEQAWRDELGLDRIPTPLGLRTPERLWKERG
jgi:hypothetical protein